MLNVGLVKELLVAMTRSGMGTATTFVTGKADAMSTDWRCARSTRYPRLSKMEVDVNIIDRFSS